MESIYIFIAFNPGKIEPSDFGTGIIENQLIQKKYAKRICNICRYEQDITKQLRLQYGFTLSNFMRCRSEELNNL